MLEKETQEWIKNNFKLYIREPSIVVAKHAFKAGFNKAKEWHNIKDKLPPVGETVLLYYGVDVMGKAIMSTGCIDCKGNWYKNVDDEPIKWQEITLPKGD